MFDPQKLTTNLIPPATFVQPIQGRKYTLTHSDITGELFLDIGIDYNYKAIDWDMRDEVPSIYPEFNHTIYYGTPRDYLNLFNKT